MKGSFNRSVITGAFVMIMLLMGRIEAQATIRRVPAGYPTIQQAINASVNGDTVLVAPGTYVENINFLGRAITVISEAGPQVTTIDGNHQESVVTFNSGETLTSVLEGFTIQKGSSGSDSANGGGITIRAASPIIRANIIKNNEALFWGGGIAVLPPSACLITGNHILSNKAPIFGAGVSSTFSSPVIENNTISNNTDVRYGGGISIGGNSSAIVRYNIISDNVASFDGGGILLWSSGAANIFANRISGNTATTFGGGIGMVNGNPDSVVSSNLIVKNTATIGGGIGWSNPPSMVVGNTIADNTAHEASGLVAEGFVGNPKVYNNLIIGGSGQSVIKCTYFRISAP